MRLPADTYVDINEGARTSPMHLETVPAVFVLLGGSDIFLNF